MRGSHKSKTVSWASDVNLCQVKLFLSDDSPALVGLGGQDHLQAKASSWSPYSKGAGSDDNFPPGFEGTHPSNALQNRMSHIPVVQWHCPPKVELDPIWQVVAGSESTEVELQNQREMRMLEAVYPRPSAIPPNPLLMGAEASHDSNERTPIIPITPIEDDEAVADASFDTNSPTTVPVTSQPHQSGLGTYASQSSATNNLRPPANFLPPDVSALGVEPDIVRAAYTALSAAMADSDQGSLFDPDLLVKILKDPMLVEKLGSSHGASPNPQIAPNPRLHGITSTDPAPVHINRAEVVTPSFSASEIRPHYPPLLPPPSSKMGHMPNLRPPLPPEVVLAPPHPVAPLKKDINYYKSLIQHGGGRPETTSQYDNRHLQIRTTQELAVNTKSRDLKPKIMKPCIYFNSSRGCRHGANCAFQHDASSQQKGVSSVPDVQSAKRMKMDREISGRT